MNRHQLEMNINLHALDPNFLNSELHYVIAKDENNFRFVGWNDKPGPDELKFYCFLTEEPITITAGNIQEEESYVLSDEPIYPTVSNYTDFAHIIKELQTNIAAKAIRQFSDEDIESIKENLQQDFGNIEKHLVKSEQGQHLLLIFDSTEVSVAANMVYFRHKAPFSDEHYHHVQEQHNKDA